MTFQAMTTTVLTHPFQMLLVVMIVSHGVRAAVSAVRQRLAGAVPTTGYVDLRAAA